MNKPYYGPCPSNESKSQNTNSKSSKNEPIKTTYASTKVFSQTVYRKHAKETGKLFKE